MRRRTALNVSPATLVTAGLGGRVASAAEPIRVYGPGGPAPAMRAVAQAFQQANGVAAEIIAGPTSQWAERAKADADIIYSGAEYMMSEFVAQFREQVDARTIATLYLWPAAGLVDTEIRFSNPIGGFHAATSVQPGVQA